MNYNFPLEINHNLRDTNVIVLLDLSNEHVEDKIIIRYYRNNVKA